VTPDGRVVADFGIAKLLEDAGKPLRPMALTREGGLALTPEFAAPEQVMGGAITTATDVYSSGAALSVARRATLGRLCGGHAGAGRCRISQASGDARRSGNDRRKALKRVPAERYFSAAAFAEDRAITSITAHCRDRYATPWKFLRRRWRAVTAVSAAALLIVVLTGFYTARLAAEGNHARFEAKKATKVSDLLISMLTAADPFSSLHETKEPTVRGLLDAGATRVHKELDGQPELQAQMLTVMGRVYERLGASDKAQALLEEALAIGRRGPLNEALDQTLNDMGVLKQDKGEFPAAVPLLEEALAIRRKLLEPKTRMLP
jgi:serine/threonine protein kinase